MPVPNSTAVPSTGKYLNLSSFTVDCTNHLQILEVCESPAFGKEKNKCKSVRTHVFIYCVNNKQQVYIDTIDLSVVTLAKTLIKDYHVFLRDERTSAHSRDKLLNSHIVPFAMQQRVIQNPAHACHHFYLQW